MRALCTWLSFWGRVAYTPHVPRVVPERGGRTRTTRADVRTHRRFCPPFYRLSVYYSPILRSTCRFGASNLKSACLMTSFGCFTYLFVPPSGGKQPSFRSSRSTDSRISYAKPISFPDRNSRIVVVLNTILLYMISTQRFLSHLSKF